MKRTFFTLIGCSVLLFCTLARAQQKQDKPPTATPTHTQMNAANQSAEGEKLFRTNCGRCHNPPETLSPREVRAVVRHMRVRAVLTDEQEHLIVKFLAP
jgi:cytochrome c5